MIFVSLRRGRRKHAIGGFNYVETDVALTHLLQRMSDARFMDYLIFKAVRRCLRAAGQGMRTFEAARRPRTGRQERHAGDRAPAALRRLERASVEPSRGQT